MARTGRVVPEGEIVCVDCGGRCFLLSYPPEDGFAPGDVVAYRCGDCLDRWDLVLPAETAPQPDAAPRRRRRRS